MSKINKLKSCLKKKRKNTEPEDYDYSCKNKPTLDLRPVKRRYAHSKIVPVVFGNCNFEKFEVILREFYGQIKENDRKF